MIINIFIGSINNIVKITIIDKNNYNKILIFFHSNLFLDKVYALLKMQYKYNICYFFISISKATHKFHHYY